MAVEIAGDVNQMSALIDFVDTIFGVGAPMVPMLSNVSIVNEAASSESSTRPGPGMSLPW
ncbi:hypothetical protein LguiB_005218 [Lonicera macranthoides]